MHCLPLFAVPPSTEAAQEVTLSRSSSRQAVTLTAVSAAIHSE